MIETGTEGTRSNDNSAGGLNNIPASMISGNRAKKESKKIRDIYKSYFSSDAGEVSWQYAICRLQQATE